MSSSNQRRTPNECGAMGEGNFAVRGLGLPTRWRGNVADEPLDEREVVVVGMGYIGLVGSRLRPDPASGFPFAQEAEVMGTRKLARYESGEDWRGTQRRHQANRKYRR
ncbi:hypothetical protein KWAN_214 [Erwinia phage vB_EamM_Kwan]|uniref:Uncharacterized protein n=1 Tax=Erwinia phage vB_EamM_Kwan TaxID=1883374 RepID=A0A1B2IE57_9CAUD|nr:hypothetical protein BIZ80_gp085 [Erwinia phage vB_EamM_Kwan]ANZ49566.1 hypothetical protein KWAN_214 [Erwinia phage vB_EamM_Kwan]